MPMDVTRVSQTLIGLGQNPNLASVLLVSLGCESVVVEEVAQAIAATGKRVEQLVIQEESGAARSVAKGELLAQDLVMEASLLSPDRCPVSDLVLGLKCGSSDTTQGLFATPVVGIASDLVVAAVVRWLGHSEERARAAAACLALARPHAARQIADLILAQVNDHV